MSIDLQSRRKGFWPEVLQNESIWGSGLLSIPTRSCFIIWLSATYSCCLLLFALCTLHYKGQRPINALQEVDTDLISQWMIISGLTRHWFVQGPKVAVVAASVFNTLNTIDCRVGGIFWRMLELDWTVRNLRSSQERKRRCLPSRRMRLGLSTRPSGTFVSQVLPLLILQLIKSRYVEALSQRQLDLLFQRLLLQPLKAEEMTLLIADVLLQGLLCCSLNTQPLNRPLFPQ